MMHADFIVTDTFNVVALHIVQGPLDRLNKFHGG